MSGWRQRAVTVPAVVLLVAAGVWAVHTAFGVRATELQQRAEVAAERLAADVRRVVERDVAALTALAGGIDDPLAVTADGWADAVERVRATGAFAEAATVNLLAAVDPQAAVELAADRAAAGEPFDLRLGPGPEHAVAVRVWPQAPNVSALGFDVTANPTARIALQRSQQDRRASSSAPLRLVQELEDQRATVSYVPLLVDDEVVGFVNLAFRAGAVLERVRPASAGTVTLRWRDVDAGALLASDGPVAGDATGGGPTATATAALSVYGPRWEFEAEVPLAAMTRPERLAPWVVAALGALVALAVLGAVVTARAATRRAEQLAEQRGRDLAARADELDQVNAELRELHRSKDRVLRSVTHDLRNPITVAGGLAGVLLDHDPPPQQRRHLLERIAHQATRLEAMVDELSTAARLQDGQIRAEPQDVDLDRLARRLVADVGVAQVVACDGRPWAHVDPLHAERILTNLLTNAQRYGAPPVEVEVVGSDGGVEVAVRDHGPGVAPADRDRIFTEFTRVHEHGEGLGLGLAISSALATLNGGGLRYEPGPGGGARFVLRLPAAGPAGAAEPGRSEVTTGPGDDGGLHDTGSAG